jgi:tetratricopeptide (TPR) repeat protein
MLADGLLGIIFLVAPLPNEEQSAQRFVEALRSRRLDAILETYVNEQAALQGDSSFAPALAVELARSLAQRAAEANTDAERTTLWKNADSILEKAVTETNDTLLRARLLLERVELGWSESRWLADWDELRGATEGHPSAIDRLRATLERADQLVAWCDARLKELSEQAPTSLQKETFAQLGRMRPAMILARGHVALELAEAFAKDHSERKRILEKSLADFRSIASDDPVTRIAAVRGAANSLRLLGRAKEAVAMIDAVSPETLEEPARSRLMAERVESLLDAGKTLEALQVVHSQRQNRPLSARDTIDPRWEYLYLKVVLQQASQMPGDPASASKLQASALRQLRLLDSTTDRIWVRRGELLLSQHARHLMLPETTEYRQAAEILTRSGDHRQAATVFRQAADKAQAKGEIENVVALLDESGRAWEKAGDFVRARDTFEALVRANPEAPIAPEALLRAAINARRAYLADRQAEKYAALVRIAEDHLAHYGTDESAGDIHYLLATMRKAERRYDEAIDQFLSVPSNHRLFSASRVAASRTYELWKTPLDPQAPTDGTLGQVIGYHESLLSPLAPDHQPLDPQAEAELVVRLSLFLLDRRVDRPADAKSRLETLLANPRTPHEWIQQARRYLIIALVRRGEFEDAERWADLHARSGLAEIRLTLERLHQEADAVKELDRKFIGRVQAHLISGIRSEVEQLPPVDKIDWTLALARVELHLGNDSQLAEAIRGLEELRKAHPGDARIADLVGLCYMRSQRYDSAANIFRTLVHGLPEGSAPWYRAKLNLIVALRRAGQIDQARRLLESLEILHPDLGGEHLRERFQQERDSLLATSTR